jgi:hypothetical protein
MSEKKQYPKCHTYVDLTTKSMLPVHVSMDAIGGRVGVPGEGEDGGVPTAGATGHIEMFNRALKAVSEKPKFFRNMQQWHAAYSKYAIVAVCTKQMTQAQVSNHRDNICQLCEICRVEGWSPLTPVLYDDMVRKEWHRRASRRDESFKFGEECKVTVDRIWAATKQRILTVLNACGVPTKDRPSTGGAAPHPGLSAEMSQAEHFRRQAQSAGDKLAQQQTKFLDQLRDMVQAINNGEYRSDTGANLNGKGKAKGKGQKRKGGYTQGNWAKKQNTGWGKNNSWKSNWK